VSDQNDLQRQVNATFDAFRQSLQEMLADEARKQVDSTLARLQRDNATFQIEGIKVDVIVSDLTLTTNTAPPSSAAAGSSARRRARSGRPSPVRRRGGGGGGKGKRSVREELLAAFPHTTDAYDTAQLGDMLATRGVSASVANIHQQLRRLVMVGELERVGRGRYRRPADKAA